LISKRPVYLRADHLRVIALENEVEAHKAENAVYSDLDIYPISKDEIFDQDTVEKLNSLGIVMREGGHLGYENSFQIISEKNENLLEAIRFALIQLNIKHPDNHGYLHGPQQVYDYYPRMLEYFPSPRRTWGSHK